MRHLSEDELVLFYYREGKRLDRMERHLQVCDSCAATYREIVETMGLVGSPAPPDRDERYGLEVWQRIRHQLPLGEEPGWAFWRRSELVLAAAAALCLTFVTARFWPDAPTRLPEMPAVDANATAGERVRLVAIGEHLEQSERVLLDLLNAQGPRVNVKEEQASAADLLNANRLYREASLVAGDDQVVGVLEELERQLLEIVHGPPTLSAAELDAVRLRIDGGALVFKVRLLSDALHERALIAAVPVGKTT